GQTCHHGRRWTTRPRCSVSEVKLLSRVRLFATPWTVAYQPPPSMGFSRQDEHSDSDDDHHLTPSVSFFSSQMRIRMIGVWPGGLLWEVLSILTCGGLGLDSQVGGMDMFHGFCFPSLLVHFTSVMGLVAALWRGAAGRPCHPLPLPPSLASQLVPNSPWGIYLLDLIYIDSAYPASGSIMENEQRSNQMNNILRIIADLQVSCSYDHLTTLPHVQKYLKSVRYIEELQKFVEDDNYNGSSSARFSRRPTCPDASVAGSLPTPPVPRHRKSHSLGNNMMCQLSVVESKSATFPSEKARHLLDDSVLESRSPRRGLALASSSAVTNGLSLGSSESSEFSEEMSSGLESRGRLYATLGPNWRVPVRNSPRTRSCVYSPTGPCICTLGSSAAAPTMEGPLRRKTLLKEGRKPALSSWTRYWVILSGSTLLYYGAKSLRGTDRKHYKSTPGKKVSVVGWMVQLPDDPEHPDIFQLNNPDKGNVYKFQTGSRFHAILWHKHLDDACKSNRPQVKIIANLLRANHGCW
ncbi:hypothetical protein FD754_008711, partial [Muntiacus muntjak]